MTLYETAVGSKFWLPCQACCHAAICHAATCECAFDNGILVATEIMADFDECLAVIPGLCVASSIASPQKLQA